MDEPFARAATARRRVAPIREVPNARVLVPLTPSRDNERGLTMDLQWLTARMAVALLDATDPHMGAPLPPIWLEDEGAT
jgi:hypothetical protein